MSETDRPQEKKYALCHSPKNVLESKLEIYIYIYNGGRAEDRILLFNMRKNG